MTFSANLIGRTLGAEIEGVDIRKLISTEVFNSVQAALDQHSVVVFREQNITEIQQIEFSKKFGPLATFHESDKRSISEPEIFRISNVEQQGNSVRDGQDSVHTYFTNVTQRWHTDGSYKAIPAYATTLYALEIPPSGADTLFADMFAAYESLPLDQKQELERRHMVHNYENNMQLTNGQTMSVEDKRALPPVTHPIVRNHLDGRKSLYLSENVSQYVGGMGIEDGRKRLKELIAFATQPQFIYRHKWRRGDLLMWDNRCVLHQATPYDSNRYRRTMLRTEIMGVVPPF